MDICYEKKSLLVLRKTAGVCASPKSQNFPCQCPGVAWIVPLPGESKDTPAIRVTSRLHFVSVSVWVKLVGEEGIESPSNKTHRQYVTELEVARQQMKDAKERQEEEVERKAYEINTLKENLAVVKQAMQVSSRTLLSALHSCGRSRHHPLE